MEVPRCCVLMLCVTLVCGTEFLSQPQKMKVREQDNVQLKCQINENPENKIVMWIKLPGLVISLGGTVLQSRYKVDVNDLTTVTSADLIIANVSAADAGTYQCTLGGTELKQESSVVVPVPVTAKIEPDEDQKMLNLLETTGEPVLQVVWTTNRAPPPTHTDSQDRKEGEDVEPTEPTVIDDGSGGSALLPSLVTLLLILLLRGPL